MMKYQTILNLLEKSGEEIEISETVEGVKHGVVMIFLGGVKIYHGHYVYGIKERSHCEWRNDGSKYAMIQFRNGMREGHYIFWRRNGSKKEEGFYKQGKLVGIRREWKSNGELWKVWDNSKD